MSYILLSLLSIFQKIKLISLIKNKKMATAKKTTTTKSPKKATSKISLISAKAKSIYKKGEEKWTDAISRASSMLKKEGKL